jgi:ABC-type sugar transport system ATPase subunit
MIVCSDMLIHQGDFTLGPLSLELTEGHYHVIMGPSGSGKTTFIEGLLGLRALAGGKISIYGQDVTNLDPAARQIGYVPQDAVMFPNMTVQQQLCYGLGTRRFDASAYMAYFEQRGHLSDAWREKFTSNSKQFKQRWLFHRSIDIARQLGLRHLLHRSPQGLSGGERQRVALGRALAIQPRVLLLDEPLAALDDTNRQGMVQLLTELRDHSPMTIVHVTHATSEAHQLADQVIHFAAGRADVPQ